MNELELKSDLSRRTHLIIIVLSALLHLFLLFFILTMHYTQQQKKNSQQENAPQLNIDNALILGQSPHQAAVIFQNPLPPTPAVPQTTAQQPTHDTQARQPTAVLPALMPEPTVSIPQEISDPETVKDHPLATDIANQNVAIQSVIPDGQKNSLKTAPRTVQKKRSKTSNKITLKDITKGFLKSMYQEQGNVPRTTLTEQELSLSAYKSKIWSALRQSSLFNNTLRLFNDVNAIITLLMTINRDGSLKDVRFERPHHHPDVSYIESHLCQIARKVGLYPPIPRQFKSDTMTLRLPIHAQCHAGTHTYTLSCGMQ